MCKKDFRLYKKHGIYIILANDKTSFTCNFVVWSNNQVILKQTGLIHVHVWQNAKTPVFKTGNCAKKCSLICTYVYTFRNMYQFSSQFLKCVSY